jgi:glutamate racemase
VLVLGCTHYPLIVHCGAWRRPVLVVDSAPEHTPWYVLRELGRLHS